MRILIAENEYLVAWDIENILSQAGHEVLGPVASVKDGLTVSKADTPELALVDLHLDGDLLGTELAEEIHAIYGTLSILVTASAEEVQDETGASIGIISKPFTPRTIVEGIELARQVRQGANPTRLKVPNGMQLL